MNFPCLRERITIRTGVSCERLLLREAPSLLQASESRPVSQPEGMDVDVSLKPLREVTGVVVRPAGATETEEIEADGVVLATGGYGFDAGDGGLLKEFRPELVTVPTTNGAFTTGDGVKLGREVGVWWVGEMEL